MFTNNKKNEITISIKRFYPKNVSSQKTVEVNKETFDFLCGDKVHKESMARKDRRHILAFPFDEVEMGERDGIYTTSAEDEFFYVAECKILYKAISMLSEYERNILLSYYFDDKTYVEVGEEFGVPRSTIHRHIKKAENNLKEIYLKIVQD